MIHICILAFLLPTALGSIFSDPHCSGGRSAITHLFEWTWSDVAQECERFLGPYGYCGVQISPPNENEIVTKPRRPWWERYQPVSYKLQTRSGTEQELKDMVVRCNKAGVRIYADITINDMTGVAGRGVGTAGSSYDTNQLQYPGVPYGPTDFNDGSNCHSADLTIHDYNNAEEVRNCRLEGLADLKLAKDYVRGKIAEYLNHLVDIGVAGFRVDAAKHMWPGDLTAIFGRVKDLRSDIFGSGMKPFIYQEVIDLGGSEPIKGGQYLSSGRVTNFIFGSKLGQVFRKQNPMKYLSNWGSAWGMLKSDDSVVFIDNHDNQRGHGGGGGPITHFEPRAYKLATAFMLAHPYGFPRVMSSYDFNRANPDQGPPQNSDMSTKPVTIKSDMSCGNGWTCEHRWRQMYNMVAFRNIAGYSGLSNWWAGSDYQIAFSRGNKAFIAFNLEGYDLSKSLNTGLPSGRYCDVISGNLENGSCTGKTINVDGSGHASIHIGSSDQDPMVAIHVGAKKGSAGKRVG
ncbi:alpha-amylase-like [Haliotis rubra]|uniref:alpha-amylase-like n=1 Tax=Haliotis rubra TaxID=36100 RepID=UPI001EE5A06D|nr:alpha-amylase-like [Haliotis rubra]